MTGVKVHVDHFRIITAFEPSPAGTAHTDMVVVTVGDRGYWEEILGIMKRLDCTLCHILVQQ